MASCALSNFGCHTWQLRFCIWRVPIRISLSADVLVCYRCAIECMLKNCVKGGQCKALTLGKNYYFTDRPYYVAYLLYVYIFTDPRRWKSHNIFELMLTLYNLKFIYLDKNICPDSSISFVYARVSLIGCSTSSFGSWRLWKTITSSFVYLSFIQLDMYIIWLSSYPVLLYISVFRLVLLCSFMNYMFIGLLCFPAARFWYLSVYVILLWFSYAYKTPLKIRVSYY